MVSIWLDITSPYGPAREGFLLFPKTIYTYSHATGGGVIGGLRPRVRMDMRATYGATAVTWRIFTRIIPIS